MTTRNIERRLEPYRAAQQSPYDVTESMGELWSSLTDGMSQTERKTATRILKALGIFVAELLEVADKPSESATSVTN